MSKPINPYKTLIALTGTTLVTYLLTGMAVFYYFFLFTPRQTAGIHYDAIVLGGTIIYIGLSLNVYIRSTLYLTGKKDSHEPLFFKRKWTESIEDYLN